MMEEEMFHDLEWSLGECWRQQVRAVDDESGATVPIVGVYSEGGELILRIRTNN